MYYTYVLMSRKDGKMYTGFRRNLKLSFWQHNQDQIPSSKHRGPKTISKKVLENGEKDETVNFWADMTKTKKALNILGVTQLKKGIELCIQSMQTAVPT